MSFEIDVTCRRGSRNLAFSCASGPGLTALFGPSGAGKTSVLDMVSGLLKPDAGRIVVAGEVLFDRAERINLPPERRACGYVFQDNRLFPHMNVRANLLYGSQRKGTAAGWMDLDRAVEFLGLGQLLSRMPRSLSGGEAQRVAIGRALLSGPRFLLMDEPLSSLDAPRREEIMAMILRIRDELKLPILYVSHDSAEVSRLASQIIGIG